MKIRLYRGPHDGKVIEGYFGNSTIIDGPKKMTRKQRYEFERDAINSHYWRDNTMTMAPQYPQVRAEYVRTHFQHPDGSIFYEWTGKSKTI